ncbi:plasmid replication initiator RepA [Rahnella laticis]|uniref:plasmid replication initiator RepA n=1 Tax=Rahnella laticis TaxID=2787622 RepID=UPI002DDB8861|nr:plasmid replication initiator RepA [Rahnella laticis]
MKGLTVVQNADPRFEVSENKRTLPFNHKLMKAAEGFTSRFEFSMHVAFARANGKRRRMPPDSRKRAVDALLQAMCFHNDPLENRVNATVTTMAIECSLATESDAGNLSITRATRALQFLALLGLITYETKFCDTLGCNFPADITFTPAFFDALGISAQAVAAARESRVAWKNKQRAKQGLSRLPLDELMFAAMKARRDRFYDYHMKRKQHGHARVRAKRDASRLRAEIEALVKRELTREIAERRFPASKDAVMAEVARRVKQRMILSRSHHTRLAA